MSTDSDYMRLALRLARRGYGATSPNPMVGAILVKAGKIIGRGWHHYAGGPHAEIEALSDTKKRGYKPQCATLYVTLEPCSTQGRTPPCTEAIIAAGIQKVVVGATDPNPRHRGEAFKILRKAGIALVHAVLADECERLNEAFNHWILHRTPFVLVKAAMSLDGKIATPSGESKWITGQESRAYGMQLRRGADAILVGINTILADDPSLTLRRPVAEVRVQKSIGGLRPPAAGVQCPVSTRKPIHRIILDAQARTPLCAKVLTDQATALTTIVLGESAPKSRVKALAKRARIMVAPFQSAPPSPRLDLRWILKELGRQHITKLLVEGGGEVNASFLLQGLAQRIAFFYAPKILGGSQSPTAVAGDGINRLRDALELTEVEWVPVGADWLLTARVAARLNL